MTSQALTNPSALAENKTSCPLMLACSKAVSCWACAFGSTTSLPGKTIYMLYPKPAVLYKPKKSVFFRLRGAKQTVAGLVILNVWVAPRSGSDLIMTSREFVVTISYSVPSMLSRQLEVIDTPWGRMEKLFFFLKSIPLLSTWLCLHFTITHEPFLQCEQISPPFCSSTMGLATCG